MHCTKTAVVTWLLVTCHVSVRGLPEWPRDSDVIGAADWDSDWMLMKAEDDDFSYRIRRHYLGEVPWKVRVFVMILDGEYKGSVFEAAGGGAMWDDDHAVTYCGVAYAFNNESVKMFAPRGPKADADGLGRIACVGGPAWGNTTQQITGEANVRALAWKRSSFPQPDFQSDWIPMDEDRGLVELRHNITGGCSYMMVQVRGISTTKSSGMWYAEAVGASQDPHDTHDRAAVVFGYNDYSVRIWRAIEMQETESNKVNKERKVCFLCVRDGWTYDKKITVISGEVRVIGWSSLFVSDRNSIHRELLVDESGPMTHSVRLPAAVSPEDFISVQVMALEGPNGAFKFPAFGMAAALPLTASTNDRYGGVVYFTKDSLMTIYLPTGKRGFPVNILSPWGGGTLTQTSRVVKISINVHYTSPIEMDSCHFQQLDKARGKTGVQKAGRHIHCARQCCHIDGCSCVGFKVNGEGSCTSHKDLLDLHMDRNDHASFIRTL